MQTTAAIATGPGRPFEITEVDVDDPRPGEVQVRMVACGVCHTDAIVRDQWYPTPLPAVLGHEGAGVVEAVGPGVDDVAVGDHVLLSFASCGSCRNCQAGRPAYCLDFFARNFGGRRADGSTAFTRGAEPISSHFFGQSSFAAVTNVARRSVVVVPPEAPLELLAPLGCGLQTGAGAVLNRLQVREGSSFVVFGAGAVGMAALLAAVVANAGTIVAVDLVADRLTRATELGATHTVDGSALGAPGVVAAVREATGGGADYALDTTGSTAAFRQMTDCLGSLGHGALVGASAIGTEASIDIGTIMLSGATISMCIEGDSVPSLFIPRLIDLHARGLFPIEKLVRTYPFGQLDQAFEDSHTGATLKPVVVF
ncbi:NAD(P)-dependent alcohol dehydrogenase [Agilicoccus flavus]|uniref:NAD(P)-dependent alcohol dehydrogenase n=1 Tax=Agilicoccus flavus TaxID=2775968 RepID=UPI001CF6E37D|nr:NAD(P)-dependent alcohol dehydrogenase [Agilicoccus flavus]